ncbi:MAG: hypothetical protein ABFS19_11670 [Thermodesulfobacteriota bacterium]
MPHAFSVEIHDYLSQEILTVEKNQMAANEEGDSDLQSYCEGQLLELKNLRQYLTDNIDLKTQNYY